MHRRREFQRHYYCGANQRSCDFRCGARRQQSLRNPNHLDVQGCGLGADVANRYNVLTFAGFITSGWTSSDLHVAGTIAGGDHNY